MTDDGSRRFALGVALDGSRDEVEGWLSQNLPGNSGMSLEALLPFHHRRQEEGWSAYAIALPSGPVERASEVVQRFEDGLSEAARVSLRKVEHLRLQTGLDMFYPLRGGVAAEGKMLHSMEYVRSRPEKREEYYRTQVIFSGPAVRRMHVCDQFGRFIGFEVVRVMYSAVGMPEWDVIHVSGFSPWQFIKIQFNLRRAFEDAAHAIGKPSGREIMRGWDAQREKRTVFACQIRSYSKVHRG